MKYLSGLEVLLKEKVHLLKNKRVGLVTNHTGVNKELASNIDLFYRHPGINLTALLAPEHGIRGSIQAGKKVTDDKDKNTGLPVYSLYGKNKKPSKSILQDIDLLIYDIQDIGVRFYTYLSTLLFCLEGCAEYELELMVLDRLNPLGRKIEGNIVEADFRSFVGLYPLPGRHGMTIGEIAFWANGECELNCHLEVIKLEGWQGELFDEISELWIPPSPNIPHFSTALVYPITFLFEGTNVSEGRGTANPFEYVGAPWVDPFQLKEYLDQFKLPGVKFRPVYFAPTFSKYRGEECGGVQVIIEDRSRVDSFLTGLTLLNTFWVLYPQYFNWLKPGKENGHYFFDLLMGTDKVRTGIMSGKNPGEFICEWVTEIKEFAKTREKYLLY